VAGTGGVTLPPAAYRFSARASAEVTACWKRYKALGLATSAAATPPTVCVTYSITATLSAGCVTGANENGLVGEVDGWRVGWPVGDVGRRVGCDDGRIVGRLEGRRLGWFVGWPVGTDGRDVGWCEGCVLGWLDGCCVGCWLG